MPFNPLYFIVGRQLAARSVDEGRATQLALLSSGMLDLPLPMGLVMTNIIAEREASVIQATADGSAPPADEIAVPAVMGHSVEQAQATFAGAGLTGEVIVQESYSDDAEADRVVGQSPIAGTVVSPGQKLVLLVGQGEARLVPDCRTMRALEAELLLQTYGLEPEPKPAQEDVDGLCSGHVAKQEPEPGWHAGADTVTVYIVPESEETGAGGSSGTGEDEAVSVRGR